MRRNREGDSGQTGPVLFAGSNKTELGNFFSADTPLPFAVKPGLTDSRFCEDAKPYRLNFYVPKLVKVVALVRIDRLSRVWHG